MEDDCSSDSNLDVLLKTKEYRIRNKYIRGNIGVAYIVGKIVRGGLGVRRIFMGMNVDSKIGEKIEKEMDRWNRVI